MYRGLTEYARPGEVLLLISCSARSQLVEAIQNVEHVLQFCHGFGGEKELWTFVVEQQYLVDQFIEERTCSRVKADQPEGL